MITDDKGIMRRWKHCFQELPCRTEEESVKEADSVKVRINVVREKEEYKITIEELQRALRKMKKW